MSLRQIAMSRLGLLPLSSRAVMPHRRRWDDQQAAAMATRAAFLTSSTGILGCCGIFPVRGHVPLSSVIPFRTAGTRSRFAGDGSTTEHRNAGTQVAMGAFPVHAEGDTDTSATSTTTTKTALILEDNEHPLRDHLISRAAWSVMLRLRAAGHETYVVGGTVRDILLDRSPKDFDLLTSAEPAHVVSLFPRAFVLGRSFPIVHVHHNGELTEVSSFGTNAADPSRIPLDASVHTLGTKERRHESVRKRKRRKGQRQQDDDGMMVAGTEDGLERGMLPLQGRKDSLLVSKAPTWAEARRENAIKRDFTVNALLYDPFSRVIYDYVGGVADCKRKILRCLGDPYASFAQDPARILRAIRFASRAGLDIDPQTGHALCALRQTVSTLPQGRLQMELSALIGYGAAASAVKLLWRYGLLDLLLPHHAIMLSKEGIPRALEPESQRIFGKHGVKSSRLATVLFDVLDRMDRHAAPDRPIDTALWIVVLAAPLIAGECLAIAGSGRQRRGKPPPSVDPSEGEGTSSAEEMLEFGTEMALDTSSSDEVIGDDGSRLRSVGASNGGEYAEVYTAIIDRVLNRLLTPLDSKSQRALWSLPAPSVLRQDDVANDLKGTYGMTACSGLLPRGALEAARNLFLLEVEMRGLYTESLNNSHGEELSRKRTRKKAKGRRSGGRRHLADTEELVLRVLSAEELGWAQLTKL